MTQRQANWLLALVSATWGASYIFMKVLVDDIPPLTIVALRFGIAFIVMIAIFFRKIVLVNAKTLKYSALVGALLFSIFFALMYGMKNTTASTAGFLTSTTVILVPILQIFITRRLPSKKIVWGVVIVTTGLVFLLVREDFNIATGAFLCLVAAFLYAIHIIVTNRFVREVDALLLGIFQLGFATLFATIGTFLFETPVLPKSTVHWLSILGLALLCSAFGFVIQSIAQKYTTAESAGFLFSLEPIFSAILAYIFLHEIMGLQGYFGATLIIAGVLIANTTFKTKLT
ncbi:DMT family transporter [Psychrobacillus lasiicapitis]|uniref:DMT family transporter n=1 Tax=Psychrobacillus lasiicapitis TaxID=1636719 RepID=A0A544THK9_9BACI|nr:DMT family transporter [Psychrobacillus lasiicapitis]TQR16901.1 DMT family transporter [Psychrobacillus lasiicapitis]GGA26233.1 multidrug transporter [Psychrobacillus lasiicapitis]